MSFNHNLITSEMFALLFIENGITFAVKFTIIRYILVLHKIGGHIGRHLGF
jgi:hypothetical protein